MQHLPSCFSPFQKMCDFTTIQPYAMIFAVIDNDAAAVTEIDAVHQNSALRAFYILDFRVCPIAVLIDVPDMFEVDIKNIGNQFCQQGFNFPPVKKQAITNVAAFYIVAII